MKLKNLFLLFFLAGWVWAGELPSIVVMHVENRTGDSRLDDVTLMEIVELYFVKSKSCRVVERRYLEKILSEQKLNQSGLTEKEIARVGALVGASKAVAGAVARIGDRYLFMLRLIDTSSATIEEVVEIQDNSLDRLVDRIPEGVERLLHAKAFREGKVAQPAEKEKVSRPSPSQSASSNVVVSSSSEEESDEAALERLINNVKRKFQQQQISSQETQGETSSTPSTKQAQSQEDKDLLKREKRRWGIIFQFGLVEEIQLWPSSWNFAGFGYGLLTLKNATFVGYEYALIEPEAGVMIGVQMGLLPVVNNFLFGMQMGLINRVKSVGYGFQMGFLNTAEERLGGIQYGFVNTTGQLKGAQLGFVNIADRVYGIQFGFVNTTRILQGVQLGMVNVARDNFLPFMFGVNIGF